MRNACSLAALSLTCSLASAQVINGGFEDPGTGFKTVFAGQTYGDWTNAGPGDIEFVHATVNGNLPGLEFSAFEGEYWIDLVGVGAPSAIFQDIPGLSAGDIYRIDWAQAGNVWGGNFNFTMEVLWNGQLIATNTQNHGGNNGANMNWQTYGVEVIAAAGDNRLMFRAASGGSARGPALDAVSVTYVPTPTAPAALGLAGLAAARRRR